ncbi:Hypothetical predicted protein [Xyrichtys novacula]|uniref:Uncharacterized protein n=1 Tax=Xyrichtys novacula TaxID=13765 RepID=A0AAV1FVN2_XYRNO|nr:Hypothetical predicted protein [Xyrichtys novacula]
MTSRLQDVASAADPVLSGCVSRQGPASPSGPAPRLTDDNTATLCLHRARSSAEHDRGRQYERERNKGREEVEKDRLRGFSRMSLCFSHAFLWPFERRRLLSDDLLYVGWKKKSSYAFAQQRLLRWSDVLLQKDST